MNGLEASFVLAGMGVIFGMLGLFLYDQNPDCIHLQKTDVPRRTFAKIVLSFAAVLFIPLFIRLFILTLMA